MPLFWVERHDFCTLVIVLLLIVLLARAKMHLDNTYVMHVARSGTFNLWVPVN